MDNINEINSYNSIIMSRNKKGIKKDQLLLIPQKRIKKMK